MSNGSPFKNVNFSQIMKQDVTVIGEQENTEEVKVVEPTEETIQQVTPLEEVVPEPVEQVIQAAKELTTTVDSDVLAEIPEEEKEDLPDFIKNYTVSEDKGKEFVDRVENLKKAQQGTLDHSSTEDVLNPFAKETTTVAPTETTSKDLDSVVVPIGVTYEEVEKKHSPLDIFEVSLDSVELDDIDSPLTAMSNLNRVLQINDNLGTSQTAAIQSGYIAHMAALKYRDTISMLNTESDAYNYSKKLYETIFNKISNTSIGKFTYTDFLNITSINDVEHLLYGIFCQTYPRDNVLSVTCGSCNHPNKVSFDKNTLITIEPEKQDETFKRMKEVLQEVRTVEDLKAKSMTNKLQRIRLGDSKIIVEIKIPTLKENLDLLGSIDPKAMENIGVEIFTMISFIKNILVPNLEATEAKGKPVFSKVDSREDIFNILSKLSSNDGQKLEREIMKRDTSFEITYALREIQCQNCEKHISNVNISVRDLLFTVMQMKAQI